MKQWKDLPTWAKIALIGGGSLGAIWILRRLIGEGNIRPARVDYGQIPEVYVDPTGGSIKWDPDPIAADIADKLEGYNLMVYPEVNDLLAPLNPDQTKLLYNHYNTYYAQDEPTLTKLLEGEWTGTNAYFPSITKLKQLGLHERGEQILINRGWI